MRYESAEACRVLGHHGAQLQDQRWANNSTSTVETLVLDQCQKANNDSNSNHNLALAQRLLSIWATCSKNDDVYKFGFFHLYIHVRDIRSNLQTLLLSGSDALFYGWNCFILNTRTYLEDSNTSKTQLYICYLPFYYKYVIAIIMMITCILTHTRKGGYKLLENLFLIPIL